MVKSPVGLAEEVGPAAFDAGAPNPACRLVEGIVGSGDGVGPAAFDAGAPGSACRLVEGIVGSGEAGGRRSLRRCSILRNFLPSDERGPVSGLRMGGSLGPAKAFSTACVWRYLF